jgi:hypothetical protein
VRLLRLPAPVLSDDLPNTRKMINMINSSI